MHLENVNNNDDDDDNNNNNNNNYYYYYYNNNNCWGQYRPTPSPIFPLKIPIFDP